MASTALLVMDVQQSIAADLDYQLTILADGCLDTDPEVHRVLTEKVFPRQADVTGIAGWTESLAKPTAG